MKEKEKEKEKEEEMTNSCSRLGREVKAFGNTPKAGPSIELYKGLCMKNVKRIDEVEGSALLRSIGEGKRMGRRDEGRSRREVGGRWRR